MYPKDPCFQQKICRFYEKMHWAGRQEYEKAKGAIANREEHSKAGATIIKKSDILAHGKIDYLDFVKSRHSVRAFLKRKIAKEDIEKAIEATRFTPSACNRQMCKIYHINDSRARDKVMLFPKGFTQFRSDTVTFFVVTYDVAALCDRRECQQGMFNAGLFSMNFVNALHSLGIGSCFLQFSNDLSEEKELKAVIGAHDSERIAVIIAAGYYPETTKIPISSRKPLDEIYTIV